MISVVKVTSMTLMNKNSANSSSETRKHTSSCTTMIASWCFTLGHFQTLLPIIKDQPAIFSCPKYPKSSYLLFLHHSNLMTSPRCTQFSSRWELILYDPHSKIPVVFLFVCFFPFLLKTKVWFWHKNLWFLSCMAVSSNISFFLCFTYMSFVIISSSMHQCSSCQRLLCIESLCLIPLSTPLSPNPLYLVNC